MTAGSGSASGAPVKGSASPRATVARGVLPERSGEREAYSGEEVESHLPLRRIEGGDACLGTQALSFGAGFVLWGDVLEVALDVERLSVAAPHRARLVSHPDDRPVSPVHAVFGAELRCRVGGGAD